MAQKINEITDITDIAWEEEKFDEVKFKEGLKNYDVVEPDELDGKGNEEE